MRNLIKVLCMLLVIGLFGTAYGASKYYKTAGSEQLYRVASKVKPNSKVSVEQVMLAILYANPEAFNKHNVNGLKAGYKLLIPTNQFITRIGRQYAVDTVHKQNKEWKTGKIETPDEILKQDASQDPNSLGDTNSAQETVNKTQATTAKSDLLEAVTGQQIDKTSEKVTASNQAAVQQAPANATNVKDIKDNAPSVVSADVTKFMEETKAYEQQAGTQLAALEQQNKILEAKVTKLSEDVRTLTYTVVQISAKYNQPNKAKILLDNLKEKSVELSTGIFIFLLLSYLLTRSFKKKGRRAARQNKKDEYDYMNSDESIPSKLDLARAYIDMGDNQAAESALKEVLDRGNREQKKGARDLLRKITLGL